jgi:uncharacterized protein
VADSHLDLLDWKRRIFDLYREIRTARDVRAAWRRWRAARDALFAAHPQTPLPRAARRRFAGLSYFPYDPQARALAAVRRRPPSPVELADADGRTFSTTRFATASFTLRGRALALDLYWVEGYGGGVLLPFRDTTSGRESYGAGRYLLDTVKGADLGSRGNRLVLDFNFAYHPSCAYDPRWSCPLPPPANWLGVPVRAGERTPAEPPPRAAARRAQDRSGPRTNTRPR